MPNGVRPPGEPQEQPFANAASLGHGDNSLAEDFGDDDIEDEGPGRLRSRSVLSSVFLHLVSRRASALSVTPLSPDHR